MRAKVAGLVMAALLVLYLIAVAQYAFVLVGTDALVARAMGIALLVLPLIGAWALIVELLFVFRAERLLAVMRERGALPVDDLPRLPSGRPEPEAADAQFPLYQAEVESEPESWAAWFRLSLAYDASGDRKRARWAMREAIVLERSSSRE